MKINFCTWSSAMTQRWHWHCWVKTQRCNWHRWVKTQWCHWHYWVSKDTAESFLKFIKTPNSFQETIKSKLGWTLLPNVFEAKAWKLEIVKANFFDSAVSLTPLWIWLSLQIWNYLRISEIFFLGGGGRRLGLFRYGPWNILLRRPTKPSIKFSGLLCPHIFQQLEIL